jgi:hypothetical protein
VFESFEALNAHHSHCCRKRMGDHLRGYSETIGERLARDLAALQTPLPAPYDACEKVATTVTSLLLVRYRRDDYSVRTTYGHRDVLVRGYVHDVVISCGAEVIAHHPRSYEREDFVFDPCIMRASSRWRKVANSSGSCQPTSGTAWSNALIFRSIRASQA